MPRLNCFSLSSALVCGLWMHLEFTHAGRRLWRTWPIFELSGQLVVLLAHLLRFTAAARIAK